MITGNENHSISLTEASAMTKKYRESVSSGTTIAHALNKSAINGLLNQNNCVGMRIYYALKEDGSKELVLTGVDQNGNDLYEGILLDRTIKCPQDCSAANPLNSDVSS